MASVTSLSDTVQQHLASALGRPAGGRRRGPAAATKRPGRLQANGILALAKKAKANPRELATQVVSRVVTG